MKDLNAFVEKVSKDKGLAQKVNKAKTTSEVVSLAKNEGYSFSENDLLNVSGGLLKESLVGPISTGDIDLGGALNFDFSKLGVDVNQNVSGEHNVAQSTGSINVNKGK